MVIVIGMPRSGTTWVAKALDAHPDFCYLHEPDSVLTMAVPHWVTEDHSDSYIATVQQYAAQLPAIRQMKVVGRLPFFPKRYQPAAMRHYNRLAVLAMKALARLVPRTAALPVPLSRGRLEQGRLLWKSIESMGRIGLLARALPEARIIVLLRHPCGIANSVLKGIAQRQFQSGIPVTEDYGLFKFMLDSDLARRADLTLEKLEAMPVMQRLAWRWALYNQKMIAEATEAANCLLVRYEDICAAPEEELARVLAFCGMAMEPQVRQYLRRTTSHHEERFYSLNKSPEVAANSWRSRLGAEEVEQVMATVSGTLGGSYYPMDGEVLWR